MSLNISSHLYARQLASGAITMSIEGVQYNVGSLLGNSNQERRVLQKSRTTIYDPNNSRRDTLDGGYGAGEFWESRVPVEILIEDEEYHLLNKDDLYKLLSLCLIRPVNIPSNKNNQKGWVRGFDNQVLVRIKQGVSDINIRILLEDVLPSLFWGGGKMNMNFFDKNGKLKTEIVDSIWKMMHGDLAEIDRVWFASTGWRLSEEEGKGHETANLWNELNNKIS